jgi:hypothetical protein
MLFSILFSFFKKHEEIRTHNMLFLMLDPSFKNLKLVSSLIGRKQGISIVQEYDMRSLFPMFLKCHQHLHLVVKLEISEQNIDVDNNLDICEMIINCNE